MLCDSLCFGRGFLDHVTMIQTYINVIQEVGMMLIGLNDMENTFDDGPLGMNHIARDQMTFGPLGYHDPYMV